MSMSVEQWVKDLAITLRILEVSLGYSVFPIAKIVGCARSLGLSLKRNKFVIHALKSNRIFFTGRRISRYTFFGLTKEGREYSDMLLGTIYRPVDLSVYQMSTTYRIKLKILYEFNIGKIIPRTHNLIAEITFLDDEGKISEPIKATTVAGYIQVRDKGFEYERIDLASPPISKKPILNNYPIIYSLYRYILDYPSLAYKNAPELSKALLNSLALKPQLMRIEVEKIIDTKILRWAGKRICCSCVDPELCTHQI